MLQHIIKTCLIYFILFPTSSFCQVLVSDDTGEKWHSLWMNNDSCIMFSIKEAGFSNIKIKNIYTGTVKDIILNNIGDCYFTKCCDENPMIFFDGLESNNSPYKIYYHNLETESTDIFISFPYEGCVHPNMSYQSDQLLFNRAGNGISLYDFSSGTIELLVENTSDIMHPCFSPDGNKFLYTSNKSGNYDIWIYDIEEDTHENLTNNPSWDDRGCWSSDGQFIAFNSDRTGNDDIWIYDLITGQSEQVTFDSDTEISPSISRDGTKISFSSDKNGQFDIFYITNPLVSLIENNIPEKPFSLFINDNRNLHIKLKKLFPQNIQIRLYDIMGKNVYSTEFTSTNMDNEIIIKTDYLQTGYYFLKLNDTQTQYVEKILIRNS